MYPASVLTSVLPLLLSAAVQATPVSSQPLSKKQDGPSINVIFFSDTNCTTTVPPTIYTRPVYGDVACYTYPNELYSSLLIDEIDDHFIGTNTALQVGNTDNLETCDTFETSLKFSIATRETVGKCQVIEIPSSTPGTPLKGGNEYRLTSLEG